MAIFGAGFLANALTYPSSRHKPNHMNPTPWTVAPDQRSAMLDLSQWTGRIQSDAAVLSLWPKNLDQAPGPDNSCELSVLICEKQASPYDLQEVYVRGEDLVLTYGQEADRTIRPQVYFSARSSGMLGLGH